jgi:hypothetical protein
VNKLFVSKRSPRLTSLKSSNISALRSREALASPLSKRAFPSSRGNPSSPATESYSTFRNQPKHTQAMIGQREGISRNVSVIIASPLFSLSHRPSVRRYRPPCPYITPVLVKRANPTRIFQISRQIRPQNLQILVYFVHRLRRQLPPTCQIRNSICPTEI